MIWLAYLAVIFLSALVIGLTAVVVGFIAALCLAWTSVSTRVILAGSLGGCCGVIAAAAFSRLVFNFLAGTSVWGTWALLAIVPGLAVVYYRDNLRAQELRAAEAALPAGIEHETGAALAAASMATGYLIGAFGVAIWFGLSVMRLV